MRKVSVDRICYNTRPGLRNESKLFKMAMETKASLVLQEMCDLPLTLTEGKGIEQRLLDNRYPGAKFTVSELEKYIRESGHIFYNRDEWSRYLLQNNFTFSVGGRFHGNMMAFSNGIPAVWIVHDERTKELVNALKLPFIYYDALDDIDTLHDFLDICSYEAAFIYHYEKMGAAYVDFLDKNGIRHCFHNGM